MNLDKEQLQFLKSLAKTDNAPIADIPETQMCIVYFLENEGHITVKREIIYSRMDTDTHTIRNTYGNILSISISERGKAYLSGLRYERRRIWIPVIIDTILSVAAIIISIIALLITYSQ